MKFQNSSIHGFKVMLCIKKRDERTDGRTEGRTDGRTNNPEAICPSNFFEVGGIIRVSPRNSENKRPKAKCPLICGKLSTRKFYKYGYCFTEYIV